MTDQTDDTQTEAPNELQMLKARAKLMGINHSNNITVEKLRQKINDKLNADGDEEQVDDDTSTDRNAEDSDVLSEDEIDENGSADQFVQEQTAPPAVALVFDAPNPPTIAPSNDVKAPDPIPTAATAPLAAVGLSEADAAELAAFRAAAANPAPNPFDHDGDGRSGGSLPGGPRKMTKVQRDIAIRKEIHDREMALIRVRITNLDPKKADLHGEIFTVANEYLGTVRKFIPYGDATENGYHIPKCIYDQLVDRKFLLIRTVKDKRTGTTRPETRWVTEFSLDVMEPLTQEELERLAISQAAAGSMDEFAS